MSEGWEFVRGSYRNKPYIRKVPGCRKNPTLAQRRARYFLAKTSHNSVGKTGTIEYRNKTIPVVAHAVAREMKGKKFAAEKRKRPPEVLLNLVPVFEAVGKAVESHKFLNRDLIPRLLEEQRRKELPRLLRWQRFHEKKKNKEKLKKKVAA